MKALLIMLALFVTVDPSMVKKINSAKSAAEKAFKSGDYAAAAGHYRYLVDSLGVNEDEVLLNFANALYLAKDTANAYNHYQAVSDSPKPDIKSKAFQQLGIMANQQGKAEEALNLFKQAIKAEPTNDDARYNYEMLKKKLDERKKQEEEKQQQNKDKEKQDPQNQDEQNKDQEKKDQEKDQENKDQQNKDQQNKDQQQKDQEQKDKQEKEQQEKEEQEKQQQDQQKQNNQREEMPNLDREKLEKVMSEEKARMILEAMKNQEKQYLQQQKRKATQSRDRNKPDW